MAPPHEQPHTQLTKSILLTESGASPMVRLVILFSGLLVIAFVGWSLITRVDEVAQATGTIVTPTQTVNVQSLNGGLVTRLCVCKPSRSYPHFQGVIRHNKLTISNLPKGGVCLTFPTFC